MPSYEVELSVLKTTFPKFLFFAEGPSEVGLIDAHLNALGADPANTKVLCFKGASKMRTLVSTFVKTVAPTAAELTNIKGIGIIADAETNPNDRVDAVIECAKILGFPHCGTDLRNHARHKSADRRFAFSFSPDIVSQGRIEDLILREVGSTSIMQCINQSIPCIEKAISAKLSEKALVQMYISVAMNNSMAGIRKAFDLNIFRVSHAVYAGHRSTIEAVLNGF